jgi:uncharacterized LabA/DUF88 family protein
MRTAVVIDYQNLLTRGHNLFLPDLNEGDRVRQINPADFAEQLINFRNQVRYQEEAFQLVDVKVFRGLPNANADPEGNRLNQSQKSRWERKREFNVQVTHRNLSYAWNDFDANSRKRIQNSPNASRFPGKTYHRREEKGIDVMCAIALLKQLRREEIDSVILASIDADLEPALEEGLESFPEKFIETTSWYHPHREGGRNRIGSKVGVWNTGLPLWIYKSVLE